MKVLLALGMFCVLAQGAINESQHKLWNEYKTTHGKVYSTSEDSYRMRIFMENMVKILFHNEKFEQNVFSYRLGVNQFTDMLPHEVSSQVNGFKMNKDMPRNECSIPKEQVATSVDWRQKGAVTPVKNQGQCGSCWAFSTTGSLEGQHFLKTNKLVSLSEQNLVDCSQNFGNMGCNGGLMDQGFQYIKSNGGIDTENSYPYTAEDGSCAFKKNNVGATDSGFCDIPSGDENALLQAVNSIGPISVGIDASNWSFQLYSGGVYDEPQCSTTALDHGVLLVGYGTENGQDYWLVKNSWGADWGEQGYIKMSRNKNNQCGIATQASYPLV